MLVTNQLSQELKSRQLPSREVPRAAIVEILLLTAPGIDDEASQWEIAYELRITNEAASEAAYFAARKQGKSEGADARVGELIKAGDLRKPLAIEINSDGSYRWKTSSPAKTNSPVLEARKP